MVVEYCTVIEIQDIQENLLSTGVTLNVFESFLLVTSARFKQEKCL